MGTPLHCALRLHHVEIAELLIAPCETLAVLDSMGRTPLHVLASEACEYADPKHMLRLADQIIQRHCPLDTMDREGLTALHYAVIADHGGLVALLLERGANPNVAVPDTHMSPLGMVALDRNASLAALLLEFGANPHQRTRDGHTPVTLFPALGALAPQPGK